MTEDDIEPVHKLLNKKLKQHKMHVQFNLGEVGHFFLPRENVIESFVVEKKGVITDFMSFYSLPSSILKHPQYSTLNVAYSYYNVANTVDLRDMLHNTL